VRKFIWRGVSAPWGRLEAAMKSRKAILRAVLEAGFILFLFYSNLLMGEFERSGLGRTMGLGWALRDIFTSDNLAIGLAAAIVGWIVVELLRRRL
jgi:hypothetical protein